MRVINSGFGVFSCEDLENRSEPERLKFYDSNDRYIGYTGIESFNAKNETELAELVDARICEYENSEDISGVLSDLEDIELITTDVDFLANLLEISVKDVLDNEFVNRIGDFYILMKE